MDIADKAERSEEVLNRTTIDAIRREANKPIVGRGYCLECGVPVEGNRRWCCPECRDAWEMKHEKGMGRELYR